MNPTIYIICQLILILLVFGLLSSLFYGLRLAFAKLGLAESERKKKLKGIRAWFLIWLAVLGSLAFSGFFRDFQSLPPRVLLAFAPPLAFILFLLFSKTFEKVLKVIPESWLVYIQSFRILMELLLWLGLLGGFVPPQMTFEWLNYDIVVGLTALMAGYVFFGKGRYRWPEAIIWNIFGMALLFNILAIALLSTPSPFRVFMNDPANTFVAEFPFIWIPGFIVPFALAMHLFSLKQLLFMRKKGRVFNLNSSRD